jgi:hypothetical protein
MDDQTDFNPKRRLCPDGACIGIIGSDGRCGTCGRVAAGDAEVDPAASVFAVLDASEGASDAPASAAAAIARPTVGSDGNSFDPNRRLCADGACVGVIGIDGICSLCGRAAD